MVHGKQCPVSAWFHQLFYDRCQWCGDWLDIIPAIKPLPQPAIHVYEMVNLQWQLGSEYQQCSTRQAVIEKTYIYNQYQNSKWGGNVLFVQSSASESHYTDVLLTQCSSGCESLLCHGSIWFLLEKREQEPTSKGFTDGKTSSRYYHWTYFSITPVVSQKHKRKSVRERKSKR